MKELLTSLLAVALLVGGGLAQTSGQASASQALTKIQFAPGTIIRVELVRSVDAKKAKVGDEVIGKTMDDFLGEGDAVLAPRGSKVSAHVAEVSPREGESASTLGIAFDKMVLKDGTEVPFKANIQAIGKPELPSPVAPSDASMVGPRISGGMSPPPGGGDGGGAAPNPGSGSAGAGSAAAINGQLTPKAQGVVGMSGVSLSPGTAQDSLLTSQKHSVKLDSGTQMIVRVTD